MRFCKVPVCEALGGILAHSQATPGGRLSKGRMLGKDDIRQLAAAGVGTVSVAFLEEGDAHENEAALAVARAVAGPNVTVSKPLHGRVNLFAAVAGMLLYSAEQLMELNRIHSDITLAALRPSVCVEAGRLLATLKIISFVAPKDAVAAAARVTELFAVSALRKLRTVLLQTQLPSLSERALAKTAAVTKRRLAALGNELHCERRCAHDSEAVAASLQALRGEEAPELYLLAGASAVCDLADEVPAGIAAAGGSLARFGMPVDPGNLLVLGELGGAPCVVLPGCARSPKSNGLDMVLERLYAGIAIDSDAIAAMGVGGLLEEAVERPVLRIGNAQPTIGCILLAAGHSSRMGRANKLLKLWRGRPLVCHAAGVVSQARGAGLLQHVVAVSGRDSDEVCALLDVPAVHNPDFARGMGTSLSCGLRALPDVDAVMIVLGDMPQVEVEDIAKVAGAYGSADIIAPVHQGKRGNPVMIGRRHLPSILALDGDQGARALFSDHPIAEVDAGPGVLIDFDTPADFES